MCIDCKSEIVELVFLGQAGILAKYRPWINTTLLMTELKQTEDTAAKAIEYFNNTRHIVLYYEDLIKNSTVSLPILKACDVPVSSQFYNYYLIYLFIYSIV